MEGERPSFLAWSANQTAIKSLTPTLWQRQRMRPRGRGTTWATIGIWAASNIFFGNASMGITFPTPLNGIETAMFQKTR